MVERSFTDEPTSTHLLGSSLSAHCLNLMSTAVLKNLQQHETMENTALGKYRVSRYYTASCTVHATAAVQFSLSWAT